MLSAGGNPVHAGWWLVVGVAVGGILLIGAVDWAIRAAMQVGWAARGGPRAVIGLMVGLAFKLVYIALFARVIGSWLGVGRYSRWLRPAYWLTDWLFEPLRRVIPPVGMFDVTPLAALFVLWVLEAIVRTVL